MPSFITLAESSLFSQLNNEPSRPRTPLSRAHEINRAAVVFQQRFTTIPSPTIKRCSHHQLSERHFAKEANSALSVIQGCFQNLPVKRLRESGVGCGAQTLAERLPPIRDEVTTCQHGRGGRGQKELSVNTTAKGKGAALSATFTFSQLLSGRSTHGSEPASQFCGSLSLTAWGDCLCSITRNF
ncbi:hypothetical protein CEXT_378781 [Caerostris extrusa]|uniref:Uncharacterized protein n=1 Tax=Caerostris extrusa TaxID=172846 RepID=A0AAV4SI56_CAEEX|nr:hypothetical protein CEXT_378781 [Caerostris extrusa]